MHRAHTLSPPIGGEVGQGGLASCTWSVVACQGGFERHQHFLGSGMAGEVDHPVTHVGLDRSAGSPSALADHLIGILRDLSYLDSRHSASIALWHTRVPLADRAPPAGSPPGDLPVPSAVAPDRTHVSSKRRSDRSQRWGRPRSQCSTTSAVHPLEGCVPTNRSVRRSERRGGVAIGTSGCVTSLPIWVDVWLSRGSASLSHRRTRPLAPVSAVCPADRLSPSSSPPSPRTPTPPPDRPTARTASRRRSANMGTFRSPRPDRPRTPSGPLPPLTPGRPHTDEPLGVRPPVGTSERRGWVVGGTTECATLRFAGAGGLLAFTVPGMHEFIGRQDSPWGAPVVCA